MSLIVYSIVLVRLYGNQLFFISNIHEYVRKWLMCRTQSLDVCHMDNLFKLSKINLGKIMPLDRRVKRVICERRDM